MTGAASGRSGARKVPSWGYRAPPGAWGHARLCAPPPFADLKGPVGLARPGRHGQALALCPGCRAQGSARCPSEAGQRPPAGTLPPRPCGTRFGDGGHGRGQQDAVRQPGCHRDLPRPRGHGPGTALRVGVSLPRTACIRRALAGAPLRTGRHGPSRPPGYEAALPVVGSVPSAAGRHAPALGLGEARVPSRHVLRTALPPDPAGFPPGNGGIGHPGLGTAGLCWWPTRCTVNAHLGHWASERCASRCTSGGSTPTPSPAPTRVSIPRL